MSEDGTEAADEVREVVAEAREPRFVTLGEMLEALHARNVERMREKQKKGEIE